MERNFRFLWIRTSSSKHFSVLILQKNIDNDIGTKNNLVSVRKSDFEVFQALAKDIEEGGNTTQKEYSQVSDSIIFFAI